MGMLVCHTSMKPFLIYAPFPKLVYHTSFSDSNLSKRMPHTFEAFSDSTLSYAQYATHLWYKAFSDLWTLSYSGMPHTHTHIYEAFSDLCAIAKGMPHIFSWWHPFQGYAATHFYVRSTSSLLHSGIAKSWWPIYSLTFSGCCVDPLAAAFYLLGGDDGFYSCCIIENQKEVLLICEI